MASRRCVGDNQWESANVSQCETIDLIRLRNRTVELNSLVTATLSSEDRNVTVMFDPEDVVDIITEMNEITTELKEITTTTQPLLPNDITSSATSSALILDTILA